MLIVQGIRDGLRVTVREYVEKASMFRLGTFHMYQGGAR